MVDEYVKCSKDPQYFIENYIYITDPDGNEFLMNLYDYQVDMLNEIHNNRLFIGLAARQAGKSQLLVAYIIWCLIFNRNFKIKYLGNKLDIALEILERIKYSYQKLPLWIQKAVKEFNKSSLTLENNSKVSCVSTTENSARGSSVSLLLLDEFAFVHRNIQDAFMA
jgi:phage terminase large subunit-like protein